MTTAHRPTWAPAKGGTNDEQSGSRVFAPSTFFRAKDQVAHTKLKFRYQRCCYRHQITQFAGSTRYLSRFSTVCRQPGQNATEDLNQKDLRVQLICCSIGSLPKVSATLCLSRLPALQAELEDKERKHFRTKGGSDFEGKLHILSCFSVCV